MKVTKKAEIESPELGIHDTDRSSEGGPHPGYAFSTVMIVFLVGCCVLIVLGALYSALFL
jgi:hypothetical protein